jgi:uncharacterized protein YeeX (DUF496 family)
MSTFDKFAFERGDKAMQELTGIYAAKPVNPSKENQDWARSVVANKAAFLANTVTARQYLKDGKTAQVNLGFGNVTLSYCDRVDSFFVKSAERGRVDCITIECAIGTFIQDIARTVVS